MIRFRNSSRPLTYGDIEPSGTHIEEVVSFKRSYENEELLVLHNVSDVEVTVSADEAFQKVLFSTVGDLQLEAGEIILPAYSTVIVGKN